LNSSGQASTLAQGTTSITATANAINSNSATLTVTAPVLASLSIVPPAANILLGTQQQFTANGIMTDGTPAILGPTVWASSDTTVATINAAGLATTVSPGSTNISASSGGKISNSGLLVTGYPTGYVAQGGRIWMKVATTNTWTYASTYCSTPINGQAGWRMPTSAELSALYGSGAMTGHGWTLGTTWSSEPNGFFGNYSTVSLLNGSGSVFNDATPNLVSCVR
jgi:hypothetical protein